MTGDKKRIRNYVIAGFILFLLIFLYIFSGRQFLAACTPIFLGISIAYLMNILIRFFEDHDLLYRKKVIKSHKIHSALCTVAAVIILLLCVALIAVYITPQLTTSVFEVLEKVPEGIKYIVTQPVLQRVIPKETIEKLQHEDWDNWIAQLVNLVSSDDLMRSLSSTAGYALNAFSTTLFGIMFAIYFLAGRERRHDRMVRACRAFLPDGKEERFFHYTGTLNSCFHDFIVCQFTQALILGVVATILLHVFRFPRATVIGTMSGFCALVPVIGGYIGAILGALIILADSPEMALFFLILIIVVQNVVGLLIFPKLAKSSLGLPAVWTLAAVLVGSGMAGITGMVIAVPLTAFAYRVLKEEVRKREDRMAPDEPDSGAAGNEEEAEKEQKKTE